METLYIQNTLELAYADDVDFVSTTDFVDVEAIKKELADFRLNVNTNKTEYTLILKDEEDWKKVKKVGSLLGDKGNIERRKQLSNLALQKLSSIWIRNDKVKQVTRLNLNTFHCRQSRTILNIKYPTVIKNNVLYQKTGESPISLTILKARWQLFGHILRQAINTLPNIAMTKYFKTEGSKQRGRPKTLIVTSLRRDLKSHNNNHWPTRLHSSNDLDHLRDIAQNRSDWKHLTTAIYRSAQAETSVAVAADGH
ncbi:hypothetical protein ElyMa_005834600 [Elysia marginata]|uniref:Reverse transcriptase domain-containing protein n=1 Tax=Elysia marginata TaxID=1093978 RepID=A0AAV4FX85_9GAST|nr:hypothetical protein ElyMa_005834600 [Elysia marginata]